MNGQAVNDDIARQPAVAERLHQWQDRALFLTLSAISVAALPALILVLVQNWNNPAQYSFIAIFFAAYIVVLCLNCIKPLSPRVRSGGLLILAYVVGVLSLIRGGLVGVGKDYLLILPLLAILFRSKHSGYIALGISCVSYLAVGALLSNGYFKAWILYPDVALDFDVWIAEGTYLALLLLVSFVLFLTFYNYLLRVLEEQQRAVVELSQAHQTLLFYSQNLEGQVAQRTAELLQANVQLQEEIADRLHAEQEARFRATLLEQLQDLVIAVDLEQKISYVNEAAARFFGDEVAALRGIPVSALHLEGADVSWEQLIRATLSQGAWHGVWSYTSGAGDVRNLEVRAWIICDPENRPEGLICLMSDVTARIRSEALLQRHNRELALLNRLITAAAAIADLRNLLEILCRELAQFFEVPQALALTTDVSSDSAVVVAEYFTPPQLSFLNLQFQISASPVFQHLLHTRTPLFIAALSDDGRLGELTALLLERGAKSVLLIPLVIRERVISIVCLNMLQHVVLDETDFALISSVSSAVSQTLEAGELRVAIEKTQAAERAKSQFITHVSHELRTPLTNIRAYLDLMHVGRPERRGEYLAIAHDETVRLQRLIEDLLYLSQLDVGQLEVDVHPVDLNQLVRELFAERERLFSAQGLELEAVLEPQLPWVEADVRALRQVLISLLTNALHFTPSGGRVVIKTALGFAEGREWGTVEVRDTGLGISETELAQLFQRFQRGMAGELTNTPGAGVGLALSKELVELQHGRLTVKSHLQEGSTFTVWLLPAAQN